MKTSRLIWRIFLVPLVTMLCAFFVAPLQAQGQNVEAYVQMSADKTTLTFFYDTKRTTREGTTWGIEEKQEEESGLQQPAWAGTYKNPNTTTTKAVVDASFKDFRPTSTEFWFKQFKALTAIEGLQYLNTTEVIDMGGMFTDCAALTSLDLKNFNTSNVTDMNWMFNNCSALTSLDLSNFNTENVTNMSGMFRHCSALTSLSLKNFNTSEVTNMNVMFSDCSSLTSLDLSNFNTSNVTEMNGMFYGCSALKSLDLSSFNTSNVTDMNGMFAHCAALTSLDLKNFNTSNVTNMDVMFSDCSSLTTLALSNFNTSNVTEMNGMFYGCSALKSLDLSSFNTSNVTDMSWMFAHCSKLASIVNNKVWKCEESQEMFEGCTALKGAVAYDESKVDVTMANPETGYFTKKVQDKPEVTTPEAYVQMSADKTTLTFFYDTKRASREGTTWGIEEKQGTEGDLFPAWAGTDEKPDTTTTKAVFDASFANFRPTSTASWFQYFKVLTAIEGLQSLNTSEVTDMSGMFYGCSVLTSLDLRNFNTEKVTDMSNMFFGCYDLKSLDLSKFNTEKVTNMGWMFADCPALTTLELKSFNTSNVKDMSGMFQHCSSFKSLVLSNFNTSNVTDMTQMFLGCSALTSLDLSSFNTSNVTNMSLMFDDCSALKSLDLKNFNTSNVTDMSVMFIGCSDLTSLNLSNFNTSNVTDMTQMFYYCKSLTSLDLSGFNTEKVKDMRWMFAGCLQLVNIVSNKAWNCEKSQGMFDGCTALKGAVSYDENKTDATMANPETGYFTKKVEDKPEVTTPEAYVQMSADKTTLTFYYDTKRATREGTTWGIEEKQEVEKRLEFPAWAGTYNNPNKTTTKVVFDASFKDIHPTSTGFWFKNFKALTAIEGLQNLNTSEVTDMSVMFAGCSALTSLDLKNFNTSKVTNMSGMFEDCSALTSLDLSNFNTSNVALMTAMFEYCSALTSLDLKGFNTSEVTDMRVMFAGCSALTSLDLKNFNTSNVTGMNGMFYGCSALKSLDLSSFNTSNVTNMGGMFYGCSKLASIVCDKAWNSEQSQNMFKGCTALKGAVAYDESKVDVTMANPETGYFTKKVEDKPEVTTPEAYVQMSADKKTLTFFYDTKRATREGTTWGIEEKKENHGFQYPAWVNTDENPDTTTTKAVVDALFANFRPNSTASWFEHFKGLTAIEGLQYLNTSEVKDMNRMFYGCSAMTSLDLKNFNTEKVTDMNGMFHDCSALTSLDLKNFNTSNVTYMNGMFAGCSAMTSLDLKSFNTEKVTDMGWMFFGCSALTNLDLKNFNTSNVTSMSNMFKRCSALPSLDLNNFNTSNVTSMDGMFDSCSALTSLDLKNFNTEKVEQMLGMFMYCSGLTTLHLTNFNTSNVTDMRFIFYDCSQLVNIVCNNTWKSKESQYMFLHCTALKGAVAYDESKTDATMANPETGYFTKKVQDKPEVTTPEAYVQMSADKKTLTFFYDTKRASRAGTTWGIEEKKKDHGWQIPAWVGTDENPDTTITKAVVDASFKDFRPTSTVSWFEGFKTLTAIEGLQNLNTSEVTDMRRMFEGCSALKSLDLQNFNTEKVEDTMDMFYDCAALTSLDLKNFNTENVKDMDGMFSGCSALTSLDLKNFNTSNVTNMSRMFGGCSALTSLDLKNFNTEKVENMSGMFVNCSALTSLDLKNFNTSNVTDMSLMFSSCSGLTSLDLKNFNTEKVEGMSGMFAYCSKLVNIVSDKTWKSDTSREMFKGCKALKGAVAYDESKTDVTMANPETGYFTKKVQDKPEVTTPEAYVQMSADQKTLTFFYDTKRATREGTTWGIEEKKEDNGQQYPAWAGTYQSSIYAITKAVFDDSFANFRPTSTAQWLQSLRFLINIEGLQNLNTSEVTDMHGMFAGCKALTSLDLKSFNTSSVTNMSDMFAGCKALTALDLSYFNTSNVTEMNWMFTGCFALTTLDLKSFNTEKVTTMSGIFHACLSLTSINIPNFNTSNVANMSRMFSDCPALTSLDLKNFNTSNVTDMRWMFAHCSKLVSIVSNKTWKCEKSQNMFQGCTALKGAVKYDASKVDVTMANPETGYFTKKTQDKPEVTTPEAYVQMSADKTTLTFFYDTKRATREGTTWDITSPIATRSASQLNAPAWGGSEEKPNSTTTKVVFNASFAKFYPKTTAEWFAHYAALKRIEGIENLNTSEVTSMKGMFTGCAALDTLDLTTFNTEKVNDMSEMFKNCANLSTVVCDKVWSAPHSEQMFYGCVKLLGKAAFDANKTSVEMANPNSGYFVAVKPTALLPVFSPAGANGIYTLQGKRVRGNLQHLPAGVYIVNGKKVVVQ